MRQAVIFHESPWLAALRFIVELVAWIAIYFSWGLIPLLLAVGALTLFSVPGDKHLVLVAIPGPLRMALEAAVTVFGIWGAARVFGPPAGFALAALAIGVAGLTHRRGGGMWRPRPPRGRPAPAPPPWPPPPAEPVDPGPGDICLGGPVYSRVFGVAAARDPAV
jgi:hypothetical protein